MAMDMAKKNEDIFTLLKSDERFNKVVDFIRNEIRYFSEIEKVDRAYDLVSLIIKELNLNENFRIMITNYIIPERQQFIPSSIFSEVPDAKALNIRIFGQPTEKDFVALKKYIKDKTKDLPKHNEIKNIKERVKIEELYNKKKEYDELGEPLSNKDIANDLLGDETKNKKVIDEIKQLRKLRNKYFGASEKN
jgi:hypothetical protein